ncbi:MAG: hypothetical protein Kow0074_04430 [Candidatus Zixiibacteriota bacterium]
MTERSSTITRVASMAWFLGIMVLILAVIHACGSRTQIEIQPAGESFLPLAEGNLWVFEVRSDDGIAESEVRDLDTVRIDRVIDLDGQRYYRIRANWPDLAGHRWLTRAPNGDVYWTEAPGEPLFPYLLFSRDVGETWNTGLASGCVGVLQMSDDYAVAETPFGRFDGVHMIGTTPQGRHAGCWGLSVARGIGPVLWFSGDGESPQIRRLVNARVRDDEPTTVSPPLSRIVNES